MRVIRTGAAPAATAILTSCLLIATAGVAHAKEYANASANADGVTVAAERSRQVPGAQQPGSAGASALPAQAGSAQAAVGGALVGAGTGWVDGGFGDAAASGGDVAQKWLPFGMTDAGPQECLGPQGRFRSENCRTRIVADDMAEEAASDQPGADAGAPAVPAVDWRVVVDRALLALALPEGTPQIGPDPSWNEWNALAVGYPIWLWTDTGQRAGNATQDGIRVSAHARAEKVTFTMGDGHAVSCATTTPYDRLRTKPGASSPTCGHTYERRGTYAVTATVSWRVDWTADANSGSLLVERSGARTLRVIELESVITG